MSRTIVSLCAWICVASPSLAETIELVAMMDNTLFESEDGSLSNGIGPNLFVGQNDEENIRRGLVAFDLVPALPGNAVIDSVSLRLHLSMAPETQERVLSAHRVFASWGEGSSSSSGGRGAASTAGDATWIHRSYPDVPWASVGGDFAEAPSATTMVGSIGFYVLSGTALTEDVRAWFLDPGASFGWLLRGDESASGTARRLDSRENVTEANRPRLFVHYHLGPDPVLDTSWGRIKAAHR